MADEEGYSLASIILFPKKRLFMFGFLKSKPFIQEEVDRILEKKPYLSALIRNASHVKNAIGPHVSNEANQGRNDLELQMLAVADDPFVVGYMAKAVDESTIFRKSDKIDAMLILRSLTFKHLNKQQTENMRKMCEDFSESNILADGARFYETHGGEERADDIAKEYDESVMRNLSEIKNIIANNS